MIFTRILLLLPAEFIVSTVLQRAVQISVEQGIKAALCLLLAGGAARAIRYR